MSPEAKPSRVIDARGIYRPAGSCDVTIESPADLIMNRIEISVDAVRATWGEQEAARYSDAISSISQLRRGGNGPVTPETAVKQARIIAAQKMRQEPMVGA